MFHCTFLLKKKAFSLYVRRPLKFRYKPSSRKLNPKAYYYYDEEDVNKKMFHNHVVQHKYIDNI